jgi:tetratricopeptide (TPR) repeat protein
MPDPAGVTPPLDEAGCAALRGFLDWVRERSRSTVILTSRAPEAWLGQVRQITVSGLNRAEAAEYAGSLLAPFPAARRRQERRSFGELLEWLDGHPLAMRLTLPRLDTTDPGDLLAALRGTIPLPAADHPDAGRSTSLPASITYSYAHLSERTQRLLPAVSLFHGVADENVLMLFSAAEGVPGRFAGVTREEWTTVLQDGVRVGLLTGLGAGMYRIHPALPGYLAAGWQTGNPAGYDRERQACEQALCTASAAFSRWLTGQIGSGDAALAYTVIGWQRRTLGAMLGHAVDYQAWADADSIVRALDAYWDTRGLGGEAGAWADRILDATAGDGQAPPEPARSLWLYTTGAQAGRQMDAGQPDQAGQTYRRMLAYLQDQPETEWIRASIAVTYHQLGMTAQARGRLDEAEDWYRKSLAISEELGNRPGMASTYHQLGTTAQQCGQLDEADDWYRKALAISEELGNRPGMASTYHQLGMTAQHRGRLDEADDWYSRSLAISEELGDRPSLALTYAQLGLLAEDRDQAPTALKWNIRCVTLFDQFPSRLTRTGPAALARLTRQLGTPALETTWRQVTGQPVPQPVRDYLHSHHDDPTGGTR